MIQRIRRGRDGKLLVFLEATPAASTRDLVTRKLDGEALHFAPTEMIGVIPPEHGAIVACRTDTDTARAVGRAFDLRLPKLPPGGYRIQGVNAPFGISLIVAGGDLFGMLAGLSDALSRGELTRSAFVYRGGDRTEKPAFPLRYYWTWDHSTNWVLDDEGNQYQGCTNPYTKRPETFLKDYRRLVDHCIDTRFNAIVIWGFLRDAHGGEAYAHEVARYAADRGVAILPGVGTTGYGGIYYEGRHPCNLETYLARHPDRANRHADGTRHEREISPYHPANIEWIERSLEWLYRSFPIGGVNLENSDLMVDHSPAARRARRKLKTGEAEHFKDQYFAYRAALDTAQRLAPDAWNVYTTYAGFNTTATARNSPAHSGDIMEGAHLTGLPYFARHMPPCAIAQWTLTAMVRGQPVPLRAWLDDRAPRAVYENPNWPRDLRPPTPRSAGFLHQASQWHRGFPRLRRGDVAVSTFAEGCLRSFEAGLAGISVHGEVSRRELAWDLNYLAMRHWTYHPRSTLAEFAAAELAPRLGGEKEALRFVDLLCRLDEGESGPELSDRIWQACGFRVYPRNVPPSGDVHRFRLYEQLMEWNEQRDAAARRGYEWGYSPPAGNRQE